jgi:hypothetical protein
LMRLEGAIAPFLPSADPGIIVGKAAAARVTVAALRMKSRRVTLFSGEPPRGSFVPGFFIGADSIVFGPFRATTKFLVQFLGFGV